MTLPGVNCRSRSGGRCGATCGSPAPDWEEWAFRAIVHSNAEFTEYPNSIAPRDAVRTAEQSMFGFRAGRAVLSGQTIVVQEVLVSGDRAAIRASWSGIVGVDRGAFTAGTELSCVMSAFATVQDGRIVRHETYDCSRRSRSLFRPEPPGLQPEPS